MDDSLIVEPVLTPKDKNKERLKVMLAILFFILAIAFFIYIIFNYGQPTVATNKAIGNTNQNTETNTPVSSPSSNDNSQTPIPVESELTYSFPKAHGFSFVYNPALWSVAVEPTNVASYNPNGTPTSDNQLVLASTIDSSIKVNFNFSKVNSGMLNGNPNSTCTANYKIIKEKSSVGALDGLARITLDDGTVIYGRNYYVNTVDTSKLCIFTSHPFYIIEKVAGGDTATVPDTNDIYWTANISTTSNDDLTSVDQLVSTVNFAN